MSFPAIPICCRAFPTILSTPSLRLPKIGNIDLAGADLGSLADSVSPLLSGGGFDLGSIASVAGDALSGSAAEQVEAVTSNLGGFGDIVGSIGGFAASLFGKE